MTAYLAEVSDNYAHSEVVAYELTPHIIETETTAPRGIAIHGAIPVWVGIHAA